MLGDRSRDTHCLGRECPASGGGGDVGDADRTPGPPEGCSCLVPCQGGRWSRGRAPRVACDPQDFCRNGTGSAAGMLGILSPLGKVPHLLPWLRLRPVRKGGNSQGPTHPTELAAVSGQRPVLFSTWRPHTSALVLRFSGRALVPRDLRAEEEPGSRGGKGHIQVHTVVYGRDQDGGLLRPGTVTTGCVAASTAARAVHFGCGYGTLRAGPRGHAPQTFHILPPKGLWLGAASPLQLAGADSSPRRKELSCSACPTNARGIPARAPRPQSKFPPEPLESSLPSQGPPARFPSSSTWPGLAQGGPFREPSSTAGLAPGPARHLRQQGDGEDRGS